MNKLFKSTLQLACVGLLLVFISGCSFEDVEVREVKNFRVVSLESEVMTYRLDLEVHNPNSVRFTLRKADVDLWLNGRELGNTTLLKKVKIEGSETTVVTADLKTHLKRPVEEYLGGLMSIIASGKLELEMKGEIKGGCCLVVSKKMDIDYSEPVDIESLMNL